MTYDRKMARRLSPKRQNTAKMMARMLKLEPNYSALRDPATFQSVFERAFTQRQVEVFEGMRKQGAPAPS